ncbi:MAG TPA: hypothetical protein VKI65_09250 [Gemmataceae bacterium]|nr:hypothetical protein [Gemmataceae bacterium]
MRLARYLPALLLLTLAGPAGAAVDLSKIDRTVPKEPAYQSKSPRYCLLVFGPEALTRVWLVLDGDRLYVDRNGDGDLTQEDEHVAVSYTKDNEGQSAQIEVGKIAAKAGVPPNTQLTLSWSSRRTRIYCEAEGRPWQRAGLDASGELQFSSQAKTAPIVHFYGPLSLSPDEPYTLERGGKATEFYLLVGTPGLGKGTFACMGYQDVPKDLHPVAEITFPAKNAGAAPIAAKVVFDKRC